MLPSAIEVWGKVMFLHLSVCPRGAASRDICLGVVCIQGKVGLPPVGGFASGRGGDLLEKRSVRILLECFLVTVRKRSLRRLCFYTCLSFSPQGGGVCPRGVQAQAREMCVCQHALRQTPRPQQTATAADGTHPTGMHSCSISDRNFL